MCEGGEASYRRHTNWFDGLCVCGLVDGLCLCVCVVMSLDRWIGVSWVCVCVCVWLCVFKPMLKVEGERGENE